MSPRLLYLVNDPGFFLSHRLPLAREAQQRGYEVHVATPDGPAGDEIRAHRFAFHPVVMGRGAAGIHRELSALSEVVRLYRSLAPDIVHHIALKAILIGGLAARMAGRPAVVATVTGRGYLFNSNDPRARVIRTTIRPLFRRALMAPRSRVIFQNQADLDLFVSQRMLSADRAVLIRGSGIDVDRFQPSPELDGPVVVVFTARMLRDKGIEQFAAAARAIRGENAHVRFRALGRLDPDNPTGVRRGWIERQVRDGVLEWIEDCDDIPKALRGSHIVCLPSYGEGLPKALLEAAASGRPIVTTCVPGCRDVVRDGYNGMLVPRGDARALAAALRTLIADPQLRARMGAAGRERACREFAVNLVVGKTISVYEELLFPASHPISSLNSHFARQGGQ